MSTTIYAHILQKKVFDWNAVHGFAAGEKLVLYQGVGRSL